MTRIALLAALVAHLTAPEPGIWVPVIRVPVIRAPVIRAQEDPRPPGGEGPLNNDTFLPSSQAARARLLEGDRAWLQVRAEAGGPGAELHRARAFEAWRAALLESSPGEGVLLDDGEGVAAGLWPDPDHTHHRRAEGVEVAVLRRLASLGPGDRGAWTTRYGPLAAEALAAAPFDAAALARLERTSPLTEAAALAALRLADLALERGRTPGAATWLERARHHAQALGGPGGPGPAGLGAALERRRGALSSLAPPPAGPPGEAWRRASSLHPLRALRLEGRRPLGREPRPIPLGRGLDPGLALLDSGAVVVQTPRALVWLDPVAAREEAAGSVLVLALEDVLGMDRVRPYAFPSSGGWTLRPATDGRDLVVVVDRGQAGRVARDFRFPARGNRLASLRIGPHSRPVLGWQISDQGLQRPGREPVPGAEVLGVEAHLEFQPGPVIHGDLVLVQARVLADPGAEGTSRGGDLWLFALELASGEMRWRRFLTRASDLRPEGAGRGGRTRRSTSGMPLAVAQGRVVVGTNVGVVSAFDVVDGRLAWSLRTRRRGADEAGWPGSRPPLEAHLTGGPAVLVAPFDSDRLYTLPLGPALGGGLLERPPEPLGTLEDLVTARGSELLFLGRDGRHRALRSLRPEGGLVSALYLDEGERFGGAALASAERVLVSSDRSLYLFDRGPDPLLLDAAPLEDLGAGRGGSVHARGDRVYVVGRDTLWILAVR